MNYLDRIESQLAGVSAIAERGVLIAKKAAYLARIGRQHEAAALVASLRNDQRIYVVHQIPIWLTLVDGLIAFFSGSEDEAGDKWLRSNALAKACAYDDMSALSSAWLAHLAFSRFDFNGVRDGLTAALGVATPDSADCFARAYLVLAECAHLAGDRSCANRWYAKSRRRAEEIGDEATIASIIFNMAVMQIVNYRKTCLATGDDSFAPGLAVLEAQSAESFESLVGVSSFPSLTPVLKAQAYSLSGNLSEAAEIYSRLLPESPAESQVRSRSWLLADWAYCALHGGDRKLALDAANQAVANVSERVQIDDLAATYSRLSQVFRILGDAGASDKFRQLAINSWGKFSVLQAKVLDLVADFERSD